MTDRPTFLCRCIRGIEWVVAAEVRGRALGRVEALGHREVRFSTDGLPDAEALRLRTADDVLFIAAGAVDRSVAEATEAMKACAKIVDRTAAKGVIHKNQAARRKSRMSAALKAKKSSAK